MFWIISFTFPSKFFWNIPQNFSEIFLKIFLKYSSKFFWNIPPNSSKIFLKILLKSSSKFFWHIPQNSSKVFLKILQKYSSKFIIVEIFFESFRNIASKMASSAKPIPRGLQIFTKIEYPCAYTVRIFYLLSHESQIPGNRKVEKLNKGLLTSSSPSSAFPCQQNIVFISPNI